MKIPQVLPILLFLILVAVDSSGQQQPQTPARAQQLAAQYALGDRSEQNIRRGNEAIAGFKAELEKEPDKLSALDGLGVLLMKMSLFPLDPAKLEESKSYLQRHIQLKPQDAQPYSCVGLIDWELAVNTNFRLRSSYNRENNPSPLKNSEPLPPLLRAEFAHTYGTIVAEGISDLQKAISLDPEYDMAMGRLNLLYRLKADMAESAEERASLLQEADKFVSMANATRNANASKGRVVGDCDQWFVPAPPAPPPPPGIIGGVPGGISGEQKGGVIGGIKAGSGDISPASKDQKKRLVIQGNVQQALLVNTIPPVYPPLALQARISGTVRLHAIVGKDGSVQELTLVSGHPLLVRAALDAVKQWRYKPLLLNGEPVEVDTVIDVVFQTGKQQQPSP
jgi:TonB family protein